MAYTVTNLVTDAFFISGIVSRDFERPTGAQFEVGLNVLNNIISDKTIESDMIPYYTKYTFNAIAGVETYFIPNLEAIDTLVFFIDGVRYQMREIDRIQFRGSPRAKVSSLPFNWNLEKCLGGALISLYFFPNEAYPMELWGLFRLASVALNQDLLSTSTMANLGTVTIFGTSPAAGILTSGELVVNGIDLAGIYNTPAALASYINTGIIPNVSALLVGSNLTLTAIPGASINILTLGTVDPLVGLNFSNFSLLTGVRASTFAPTGLDEFYTSYLKFSLADRLCTEYNFIVPPGVVKQLEQYQRWISKRSGGLDLNTQLLSTLQGTSAFNYATVNLGLGWTI